MTRIKLDNITKTYQDADNALTVLSGVNFEFPENSSIAIIGRSGIGKSTLLQILGGLDRVSAGTVFYDNENITALSDDALSRFRGKYIGFVFQFHHLLPEFSAEENIAMPLIIDGKTDQYARREARDLLSRVGLLDRATHRPGQLSGGEQQRVALARAMVAKPKVLLADEPTGNLDVTTARSVEELLLEVQREQGTTLIVVTHSMDLARRMQFRFEMQSGGQLGAL